MDFAYLTMHSNNVFPWLCGGQKGTNNEKSVEDFVLASSYTLTDEQSMKQHIHEAVCVVSVR